MPDDDQDILLDWGLALSAAREPQRHGDRQERADRGKRRRSPSATITRRGAPGAQLLAFPAGRRVGEIRRLAEYMRRLSCEGGEAHLRLQLRLKAEALRRRGFSDDQVARQMRSLEAAVRGELWRCEFGSSDSRGGPER